MKELVTKTQKVLQQTPAVNVSAVALHILIAVFAFFATRTIVFDSLLPFGLAFCGGCTAVFLPSCAIGALLGYFFNLIGSGGLRYLAALLAIVAIRLVLSGYQKICNNPFFLGAVASLSNSVTKAVTYSGVPIDLLKLIAESIIIFGAVFIINHTFTSLSSIGSGLAADEMICVVTTMVIIIIGLINFFVFKISVGRTLGIFLLLVSARYGGVTISSACGIALSFACAATSSYENGIGIYAFAGLAAGIFSSLGKYAAALSVTACGIIGISFFQFKADSTLFFTEILIASTLFLLIPRSFGIYLGKFFYRVPKINTTNHSAKELSLRLEVASSALVDVAETVNQVSQELAKINSPDFKSVLAYIEQDACTGCKLRLHCWENKSSATIEAIMQMINVVKGGESPPEENVLDEFRGRCLRVAKMQDTVKHRYSQYASHLSAENRIEEVRQVVSEQFEGVSNMLKELSLNITANEHFNPCVANAAASTLKSIGIHVEESIAKIDAFGRMSLEMKIKPDEKTVLNRLQIMKMLSLACERNFDAPHISRTDNCTVITLNEHPNFKIDIGVQQSCAALGSICGDSCKYFYDGKGHCIMILSDGMGTGGRAAVDGAMASGLMSRLLKAGFGYDCSLKILNSSMLFKSSDESLATLDIASIDLFSGNIELYKAGAAPTLVRRNGHSGRAESHSLPVGILKEVSFDRAAIRLRHGDIILLVSDGVTFDGTEWIRQELENWNNDNAQDLAEHICDCAHRRYTGNRTDDITVMAAILKKAI